MWVVKKGDIHLKYCKDFLAGYGWAICHGFDLNEVEIIEVDENEKRKTDGLTSS